MATHAVNTAAVCPQCGHQADLATNAAQTDARPDPGDLTCCIDCGTMLVFDRLMKLNRLTDSEFKNLPLENQREMAGIQKLIRNAPRPPK